MSIVLMFPSLGCISKPIGPSQLAPPASLSRHVRRPSRCQAMRRLCSFSPGESRAVSLTQLNVPSHQHKLKPTPVAISRLAVPSNVADLALSSFMYSWECHWAGWMWQWPGHLGAGSVVWGQTLRLCVHWGRRRRSEEVRIKCLTFLSQ